MHNNILECFNSLIWRSRLSKRDYRILMGAANWHHQQWGNDTFYPDDLPEDWYLSFYANEFPVGLVENKQWLGVDAAEELVDEIIEQATPGFKCVFELDLSGDNWKSQDDNQNKISARLNYLDNAQEFISGLLVLINAQSIEDKRFCDVINSLSRQFAVCLELVDSLDEKSTTALTNFCEQHFISVCWRGEGTPIVPDASKLWVVRCDSGQENKVLVQQLKILIAEQLKLETLSREHVLIVDGVPPKIETIRNAMIMMDIM